MRDGTGGESYRQYSFSPLEEKVIELIDLRTAVDGVVGAKRFGGNRIENSLEPTEPPIPMDILRDTDPTENDLPSASFELSDGNNNIPPPSRAKKNCNKKNDGEKVKIFIEQNKVQAEFFKDLTKKLSNLDYNVKELARIKRREYKQREERLQIEKRKLEIEELKLQEMKQERISKEKGNVMKLEVKKQKLYIEQEKLKLKQKECDD